MKILDILERDRERLLTDLAGAGAPERAAIVLENELDKLLLQFNDQSSSERERDTAAYIMQAARFAIPLIDCIGDTKVWEQTAEKSKAKLSVPGLILAAAGAGLTAYGTVMLFLSASAASSGAGGLTEALLSRIGFAWFGAVLLFLGGLFFARKKTAPDKKSQHVEWKVDPDKVYRQFRTIILSVDQSLEEIRAAERWSQREQAGNIDGRPALTPEIELFSDLLAASYSEDPEYALEKIDDIRYYLHKQQIEVVDYTEETARYFDRMPGTEPGTIRPALVADGALLRKGLASSGK